MGKNPAAQTPFLDELAASEAISYRNAYCQNPVCVPSRCSFLTGQYPHVHGHRTMRYMLHTEESSILRELKNAGYHVWMNARNDFLPGQEEGAFERHASEVFYGGEAPVAPGPEKELPRGMPGSKDYYSHYLGRLKVDGQGRNYSSDDEVVDAAVQRILHPVEEKPFCLFLGLFYPHPPYEVEEPYFSAIDRAKLPPRIREHAAGTREPLMETIIRQGQQLEGYAEEDWDELRACYAGMCLKIDWQFRRLCDALKEAGSYDDTAIFFFSDHGDYQGQFGLSEKSQNTFEDCLTRVPFLIKPPKGIRLDPGISDSLVELVDFYATAMDLAGITPDHTHFGRSLRQSIGDRSLAVREFVCCEGGRLPEELHCDESHATGSNGAISSNEYYPRMKAQEDDTAHAKATMLRSARYKYIRRLREPDQLFDMTKDPGEQHDLIDDPALSGTVGELRLRMLDWYQATCDVVPYSYDGRFSGEMIWSKVKKFVPEEKKPEIMEMAKQNLPMFKILRWAESGCKEPIETESPKEIDSLTK